MFRTLEDKIFDEMRERMAGKTIEEYAEMRDKERINNARTIKVADFTLEYPHKIAYLTITTDYSTKIEFGMFASLDKVLEENNCVIARVYNRPLDINQAVIPSTYKFEFASREMMDSFMNQFAKSRQIY